MKPETINRENNETNNKKREKQTTRKMCIYIYEKRKNQKHNKDLMMIKKT